MTRRTAPYLVAIGGAIATTAVIGGVSAVASVGSVASLSAFYLLLVLWLAARWGRGPALAGSLSAFLLYDYYFVPPVGTFAVRGPAELLELVVLLAVALVTSQLAASLPRPGSPELKRAFWAGYCSKRSPQPVWTITMSPSRRVALYILSIGIAWMVHPKQRKARQARKDR